MKSFKWMNIGRLSKYIGLPVHTIFALMKKGDLPFEKTSDGQLIFWKKDVDQWRRERGNNP